MQIPLFGAGLALGLSALAETDETPKARKIVGEEPSPTATYDCNTGSGTCNVGQATCESGTISPGSYGGRPACDSGSSDSNL